MSAQGSRLLNGSRAGSNTLEGSRAARPCLVPRVEQRLARRSGALSLPLSGDGRGGAGDTTEVWDEEQTKRSFEQKQERVPESFFPSQLWLGMIS